MPSKPAKILYADDHDLVRETVGDLLQLHFKGVEILYHDDATHISSALNGTDLIILDWNMTGINDRTISEILAQSPNVKVVILSGLTDPVVTQKILDMGAHGFIPKTFKSDQLLAALDLVMSGLKFVPEIVYEYLCSKNDMKAEHENLDDLPLTFKETEILQSLAGGGSNKVIAREHDISEATVKSHLKNIFAKLGFRSRGEAMNYVLSQKH